MLASTRLVLFSSPLQPETKAWAAAVAAAGGALSSGRARLVNTVVKDLKNGGVWTSLDRLWLRAAENVKTAAIDLVSLSTATAVNSPTFTPDRGDTGDGTSSYVNLGFSSPGPNYTQNSASAFFYSRTNHAASTNVQMGSSSSTHGDNVNISTKWSDGNIYAALNDNNSDSGRVAPSNVSGLWAWTRNSSTAFTIYQNGSSFATGTTTSTDLPNQFMGLGCIPGPTGTPGFFSNDQFAAAGMGGGLTAAQVATLSSVLNAYMTAIGANVY